MTLKEILAERRRAQSQQASQQAAQSESHVDVVVAEPACIYRTPVSEYEAIFAGCTDF